MDSIVTDIFKIKTHVICRTLFLLYGKPWIIGGCILLTAAVLLGIFLDLRWIIIALMIVFIVSPMILSFLFFYYGMNPISVINSPPHQLEFDENGIMASIFTQTATSQPKEEADIDDKSPHHQKDKYEKKSERAISYSSIYSYIVGTSDVIIRSHSSGEGFLIIPLKAFNDNKRFIRAIDMVANGMRQH